MSNWIVSPGYLQGAFWTMLIGITSVSNDLLMRFLGSGFDPIQIVFCRFFLGVIILLPFIILNGPKVLKTSGPKLHILRAIFGSVAITACCYSVNKMPLPDNTAIMFSQPLFFLPMAWVLLKERFELNIIIATIIGFIGVLIILQPGTEAFRIVALIPILAAVCFASLDILAKKMVSQDSMFCMLFYFSLGTALCLFIPAYTVWKTPTLFDWGLLLALAAGGHIIQVFLIFAFRAAKASATMPFRYMEIVFSYLASSIVLNEFPAIEVLYGATLIILGTFYIGYVQAKNQELALQKI